MYSNNGSFKIHHMRTKNPYILAAITCGVCSSISPLGAQIIYQGLDTEFTEDFDTLPSAGSTFDWFDSDTIPGWYVDNTTSNSFNPAKISHGSSTTGKLYSFGSVGSTERALGSLSSSSVGGVYLGTKIINQTGTTINSFEVSYTGEQWRSSGAAEQSMLFTYGVGAPSLQSGNYVNIAGGDFTSPTANAATGSLDGNLAANRTAIGPLQVTGLDWKPNEAMWLRWFDPDHTGTDHGLAIDDFSFSASSLDSDNDLMTDIWEDAFSLDPLLSSDAATDADGDGFNNQEEFWMDSDPTDPSSPPVIHVDQASQSQQQSGTISEPYKTINAAIAAADPNLLQAILVNPGIYHERPYADGKANIHIFSAMGAESTIIDGDFVNSSVVRMYSFTKSTLSGFTIKNALTNWTGAGVRVDASAGQILITDNVITNNHTSSNASSGGGGGIYLNAADGSIVSNNIIVGNSARRGGGVIFNGGIARFLHNTVVQNEANSDGLGGALSAIQGTSPEVRNCIFWGNTGAVGTENFHQIGVTYSIVENGTSGDGNLSSDPLFVDANGGDYHVTELSPAIAAGYPVPVILDADHELRVDLPTGTRDIGAYEFVPDPATVDTDGDGLPDLWEIAHGLDPSDDGSVNPRNGANGDFRNSGVSNIGAFNLGVQADPNASLDDYDGDGAGNNWENQYGLNPLSNLDTEGDLDLDGLTNAEEFTFGTDPTDPDSDDDYVLDGAEAFAL